ncbi:hypothetical protein [Sediminibacillus albus]|uniref:N-acetyltransferase domain-containing protein n=1 Tax=Sediminibacillus albus TaxID=407036 RepID=A0A1G8ZK73_9BACI|nr:hypothetical protein [Sediminibacillus albus]SDK15423.1 hypothetical protein SAMN05216243_2068 [Sediminibacillus albus]
MKLISASQLDDQALEVFFEGSWNTFSEQQSLREYGRLIDYQGEYKAFFALIPVEKSGYWLKSLYIKDGVPGSFPLAIIETAIAMASEQKGTGLFIHSHQPALDTLLSLLEFQKEPSPAFPEGQDLTEGQWWTKKLRTGTHEH